MRLLEEGTTDEKAENGIRTRDPQLGKLMLYQLSYFRVLGAERGRR